MWSISFLPLKIVSFRTVPISLPQCIFSNIIPCKCMTVSFLLKFLFFFLNTKCKYLSFMLGIVDFVVKAKSLLIFFGVMSKRKYLERFVKNVYIKFKISIMTKKNHRNRISLLNHKISRYKFAKKINQLQCVLLSTGFLLDASSDIYKSAA